MSECEKIRIEITALMDRVRARMSTIGSELDYNDDLYQSLMDCRRYLVEARRCLSEVEIYDIEKLLEITK